MKLIYLIIFIFIIGVNILAFNSIKTDPPNQTNTNVAEEILFFEDFSSDVSSEITFLDFDQLLPTNYSQIASYWQIITSENKCIGISSWLTDHSQANDWIILPEIELKDNSFLIWKSKSKSSYNTENYKVLISTVNPITTDIDTTNFISIKEFFENSTNFVENYLDLKEYKNQKVWIAIKYCSKSKRYLYFDDIKVTNFIGTD